MENKPDTQNAVTAQPEKPRNKGGRPRGSLSRKSRLRQECVDLIWNGQVMPLEVAVEAMRESYRVAHLKASELRSNPNLTPKQRAMITPDLTEAVSYAKIAMQYTHPKLTHISHDRVRRADDTVVRETFKVLVDGFKDLERAKSGVTFTPRVIEGVVK